MAYIGLGMEQLGSRPSSGAYLTLYRIVETLVWRYLSPIFYWITDVIGLERWEGTIEYLLMAPIHRLAHMAGQTVFSVVYSLLSTGIILAACVALFDLDLAQANVLGGASVLPSGSFAFVGAGIVGSTLPLLFPERGSQMTHVIVAVLMLVSGVYYPVTVLPPLLQRLAVFSPATYVLRGVRHAMLEGAALPQLWPDTWPALLLGLLSIPIGLQVFGLAERYAKRAGKLHRNG